MNLSPDLVDGMFWPFMEQLSACLCSALAEAGGPELCFCGVVPGGEEVDDSAALGNCGGMAWVRMATGFPSITFPEPDSQPDNCRSLLAATIELGVTRSIAVPKSRQSPNFDELVAATRLQLSDMTAMHRAILCCLNDDEKDRKMILLDYAPNGPEAGLYGGTWTLTVQQEF